MPVDVTAACGSAQDFADLMRRMARRQWTADDDRDQLEALARLALRPPARWLVFVAEGAGVFRVGVEGAELAAVAQRGDAGGIDALHRVVAAAGARVPLDQLTAAGTRRAGYAKLLRARRALHRSCPTLAQVIGDGLSVGEQGACWVLDSTETAARGIRTA